MESPLPRKPNSSDEHSIPNYGLCNASNVLEENSALMESIFRPLTEPNNESVQHTHQEVATTDDTTKYGSKTMSAEDIIAQDVLP